MILLGLTTTQGCSSSVQNSGIYVDHNRAGKEDACFTLLLIAPSDAAPHHIHRGCVTYATGRGRASRVNTTRSASVCPSRAFHQGNKQIGAGLPGRSAARRRRPMVQASELGERSSVNIFSPAGTGGKLRGWGGRLWQRQRCHHHEGASMYSHSIL